MKIDTDNSDEEDLNAELELIRKYGVKKHHPRLPVSEELFEAIINHLKRHKLTPKMLDLRKGENPSEIIFLTSEGEVKCQVREDDLFIIFEMPSSQNNLGLIKHRFFKELSSTRTHRQT